MKTIHAAIGIIYDLHVEKILISKRRTGQSYAGYWELPGGKIEPGELPFQTIIRELKEELDIDVTRAKFISTVHYQYPEFYVTLEVYRIEAYSGLVKGLEGQELLWIRPKKDDLKIISPLLPASSQVLELLI
jgi:8-oxo-dGTP diphosphatase